MKKQVLNFIIACSLFLISKNTFAAVHTFDWNGSTEVSGVYPWASAANWTETGGSGDVPGSASTDIVRFGTNVAFINQPTLSGANVTVASIIFGSIATTAGTSITVNGVTYLYNIYNPVTLTVTGVTLTAGSITENHAAGTSGDYSTFLTTLTGTGTIICTGDFTVGNAAAIPPAYSANVTAISSTIAQLTINGNLLFNSCGDNSSNAISYPYFSLDANKLTLLGQMQYAGANGPLTGYAGNINSNYHNCAGYSMDTYANATTLELQNANAVVTAADFAFDFTNGAGYATVVYDDPTATDIQIVYASNSTAFGILPYNYVNLLFSGPSTKKTGRGHIDRWHRMEFGRHRKS